MQCARPRGIRSLLYTNSAFSRSAVNGVTSTTAQSIAGGVRYDLNVSDKAFGFGTVDLFNDRFQDLDLRTVIGAGGGYHAIKNNRTTFDVLSGGTFDREFFTTFNRSSAEVLLGETLTHKFLASSAFNESVFFYPNMSSDGKLSQYDQPGPGYQAHKALELADLFQRLLPQRPAGRKEVE